MPGTRSAWNRDGLAVGAPRATPSARTSSWVRASPVAKRKDTFSPRRTVKVGPTGSEILSTHRPVVPPGGAQQKDPNSPRTSPDVPDRKAAGGSASAVTAGAVVEVVLVTGVLVVVELVVLLAVVDVVVAVWARTGPWH